MMTPTRKRRSSAEMTLLDVGDQTFRVAVRPGDPGRTPLLLLNGIGASLETFQPFVDALDPTIPVIRIDVPGIGGSPLPRRPYRFSTLSRRIGRLLDQLGHPVVDVLGISWGGGLAQQLALTEAKRVRRLILVATGTGSIMVPGRPSALMRMATPRRHRDPSYALAIAGDLYGGSVREHPDHLRELLPYFGRGGQTGGYVLQLLAGAGWTSLPLLPFVRQPTLVLAGDDDPIIHPLNGRILAVGIRRARRHVYAGGHIDLVANPAELVASIEEFLAHDSRFRTLEAR